MGSTETTPVTTAAPAAPAAAPQEAEAQAPPSLYNVLFVLGGPGAGKGTQCARIVEVRVNHQQEKKEEEEEEFVNLIVVRLLLLFPNKELRLCAFVGRRLVARRASTRRLQGGRGDRGPHPQGHHCARRDHVRSARDRDEGERQGHVPHRRLPAQQGQPGRLESPDGRQDPAQGRALLRVLGEGRYKQRRREYIYILDSYFANCFW